MPQHRWQKGETGNPNGRPKKGQTLTEEIQALLDSEEDGQTIKRRIARKLIECGLSGDTQALRLLLQYVDGMPKQNIGMDVKVKTWKEEIMGELRIAGTDNAGELEE